MSLLTRCPACTTLYRVVPDQLRISEGWVKCGQCGDIFDASQHLIEAVCDPAPPKDQALDTSPAEGSQTTEEVASLPERPAETDADVGEPHSLVHGINLDADVALEAANQVSDELAPTDATYLEETQEPQSLASESSSVAGSDSSVDEEPPEEPTRLRWDDQLPDQYAVPSPSEETATDEAQVSFMHGSGPPSFWRKPLLRGVLLLVSCALVLLLLAQCVYLGRDRLAAQYPDLKPMLQTFCGLTNCVVQPMQRIESLSVDSVVFHQLDKEVYRLTFSIKNSHPLSLALPSVELALTDAQDQPVYRRVFSSPELGVTDSEIASGAELPVVLALRVSSVGLGQRIFGYRLLAFYP